MDNTLSDDRSSTDERSSAFPRAIADLVERYHDQRYSYKSTAYKEAQLREEFINPFWWELGWDIIAAPWLGTRTQLERQIAGADQEIDQLVYQLYGLTTEEIGVVEGV